MLKTLSFSRGEDDVCLYILSLATNNFRYMAEIVPLRQGEATVFWIELYIVQVVLGLTISDAETQTILENQINTNSVAGLATCVTKTSASVVLFM